MTEVDGAKHHKCHVDGCNKLIKWGTGMFCREHKVCDRKAK